MLPPEKGKIIEINHSVSRDIPLASRMHPTAIVNIKIDIFTDSLYYTDEKHREMIDEIDSVIKKYI